MALDALVDSSQLNSELTSVANAIRTKGGTSAQLAFPAGFVSAVQAIPTGGGGNNAVFSIADFVIGTVKWTAQNCIPNVLKTGGCLHIVFTEQTNSSSSGRSIFSFGIGLLNNWAPGASSPSVYINVSANNSSAVQAYFRGVGNNSLTLTAYADNNGKVDLKLYADHFEDVNTGESHTYSADVQSCMTAISSPDYISVGQNQSNTFAGFLITLIALEEN